jgi:hypothetical protein
MRGPKTAAGIASSSASTFIRASWWQSSQVTESERTPFSRILAWATVRFAMVKRHFELLDRASNYSWSISAGRRLSSLASSTISPTIKRRLSIQRDRLIAQRRD